MTGNSPDSRRLMKPRERYGGGLDKLMVGRTAPSQFLDQPPPMREPAGDVFEDPLAPGSRAGQGDRD